MIAPGQQKIGWLCAFVPQELILAAGLQPVLLWARPEGASKADAALHPRLCPRLKAVLHQALSSALDDLAGVVLTNSCDGLRRTRDVWAHHPETPEVFWLNVPRRDTPDAVAYFVEQLGHLAAWLAQRSGTAITPEGLDDAIEALDHRRDVLHELFQAQRAEPPPHAGSALVALGLSESRAPWAALDDLLAQHRPSPPAQPEARPRLVLLGTGVGDPSLVQCFEQAGAAVVAADFCQGMRQYETLTGRQEDPLLAVARRALTMSPCPRMASPSQRVERLGRLVRDFAAHGVVYVNQQFCDYGLFDAPLLERQAGDLPFMVLQADGRSAGSGQLQTRIDAFVETLQANQANGPGSKGSTVKGAGA